MVFGMNLTTSENEKTLDKKINDSDFQVYEIPDTTYDIVDNNKILPFLKLLVISE